MFTDPIADMLTRIRNAQLVKKSEVFLPYSNLKFSILKLLEREHWIDGVEVVEPISSMLKNKKTDQDKSFYFKQIKVKISYHQDGRPKAKTLKRVSRPGRRFYVTKENLPKVLNGWGMAIISTSKGLMTDKEAKKQNIGGEVVCEIS